MTANAIISGTFADLKTVKSRSVVQMIVEVPIERGEEVVKMFGFPQPGSEVSVAVARLAVEKEPEPEKPRQQWDNMSRAQQAGILCADAEFWKYMRVENEADAIQAVYDQCGVTSRRNLDMAGPSVVWDRLVSSFRIDQQYGDMIR